MKEIEVKSEFTIKYYRAFDGTDFKDSEECQKYEESAYGVIASKLMECVVKENVEIPEFDISDENVYHTIVPRTEEHIDLINQIYFMFNGRTEPLCTIADVGTPILWGFRLCNNVIDWAWFYKLNNFIEKVTNNKFVVYEKNQVECGSKE